MNTGIAIKSFDAGSLNVMRAVPEKHIINSLPYYNKVKSCYNPLRLGTVIVFVFSGIDFVNTPLLYSDRATR